MRVRPVVLFSLVLAIAPAFLFAQAPPPTGAYLGPLNPIKVDTNHNGIPDAGDQGINLIYSNPTLTVVSPYDCNTGDTDNVTNFLGLDGNGKFTGITRTTDNGSPQTITLTNFGGGGPNGFFFCEGPPSFLRSGNHINAPACNRSGDGALLDTNGDGAYDTITGAENAGPLSFLIGLLYVDTNGDGMPDYVSLPWSQTGALGVIPTDCQPTPPQAFVPLSDSNGDGVKDKIILDLNGDGTPDPEFYTSPVLVAAPPAPPVPTISEWTAILLSLGLCVAGVVMMRRRGFDMAI